MTAISYALTGAKVFSNGELRDGLAVVVEGRYIRDVFEVSKLPQRLRQEKLEGGLLAPGFIDIQVNGGGGVLFNSEPTIDGVRHIARAHRRFGTTGLLPTVITDAPEVIAQALQAVRGAREEGMSSVLGIHVEGPFIDARRKGAHEEKYIREMTETDFEELTKWRSGVVMVTLAPNRVRAQMIARLAQAGIIVSLGHSDATSVEADAALKAGAKTFTHLFNAMSQMEGRAPGMVGTALADEESYCTIIADGHHVSDVALTVTLKVKPRSRVVLITDAMSSAAGGPSQFFLQGRTVSRKNGRLELDSATLAGSDLTMDEAVRYCVRHLGCRLEDALAMASENAASLIGLRHELGRIAPGCLASLVHLDDDLRVQRTWIEGT